MFLVAEEFDLDRLAIQSHTAVMGPELEPGALAASLLEHLGHRRICEGMRLMDGIRPRIESLEPRPGDGVLLGLAAQWMDAGFDGPAWIGQLLRRFPTHARGGLPVADYLHLRMAEAAVALARDDFDCGVMHLEMVLPFQSEIDDPELFAIANFWLGRALRKQGHYDEALRYTECAERLALGLGYTEMAAIMQATLSWLAFQKGKLIDAGRLLRNAEDALNSTDDFLSRGNVQSAYGRIARRQGKYETAVERFERAIAEFRKGGGEPLALARTLANLAFVKCLLARRAQFDLDHSTASRRGQTGIAADADRDARMRIENMREQARECLSQAGAIYDRRQNQRGIAAVRITHGYLFLDSGDLESAAREGAEAFLLANEKADSIIMARARILQCMVEITAIDEEVGDASQHRDAAEVFGREAVTFAGQTENRRLLARALVWEGLALTAPPADREAARRCCEQAMALVQPEGAERQYVWDELEALKARVLDAQPVEPRLRAWSAGIVEGQSFQQITEEFARIVIRRVWEREGCKVSRVAEKLSISPKKVRRILNAARGSGPHE